MTSKIEGRRERFQKWVLATKHPVLGFLDGHWLVRGDDREGYANEYVQGLWVAFKEFASPEAPRQEPVARWTNSTGDLYRLCPVAGNLQIKISAYGDAERWRDVQMSPAQALATLSPLYAAPLSPDHSEPVAYMRNEGTPSNLVKCGFTDQGAFGVYRGPVSRSALIDHSGGAGEAVLPERDWAKEMMEIAKAQDYFPFPMDSSVDKWFIWNWSEWKARPINKYHLCDVLLSDGRLLFDQSPYNFDWPGDQVFAARQGRERDSDFDKIKDLNQ